MYISLDDALSLLHAGKVLIVPTEGVYGLSADPSQEEAIRAVLSLKKRESSKGFILVAHDVAALAPWIEPFTPDMETRILPTWPGPCTWVVPAKPNVSPLLRGKHHTLAVRVTAHPVLKSLCEAFGGALLSTSANREGEPAARSLDELLQAFETCPPILAGELGGLPSATPIFDGLSGKAIRSA